MGRGEHLPSNCSSQLKKGVCLRKTTIQKFMNSLDPIKVQWSSVRADGEDKWLKKAGEAASAAGSRKSVMYPVLSGRVKKEKSAVTYKEALEYAAGAAAEDSE